MDGCPLTGWVVHQANVMANHFQHGYNLGSQINDTFHLLSVVDDHCNRLQSMRILSNIERYRSFSWSQTIDVSLVNIRNGNGSFLVIWYLLYESVSGYYLVKDSLRRDSLMESVTDFWGYGE
jgi:hypothetical protein